MLRNELILRNEDSYNKENFLEVFSNSIINRIVNTYIEHGNVDIDITIFKNDSILINEFNKNKNGNFNLDKSKLINYIEDNILEKLKININDINDIDR